MVEFFIAKGCHSVRLVVGRRGPYEIDSSRDTLNIEFPPEMHFMTRLCALKIWEGGFPTSPNRLMIGVIRAVVCLF